jgi:LPXTG-motif cell wall-anchored protein
MTEQTNTGEAKNVWMIGVGMLVVGLIVGFLVGWFWQKNVSQGSVDESQNSTSTEVLSTSTVPALATAYKTIDTPAVVSIDDQRAGSLVFVKHTEVSKPTWIAVREIADESIGNIIGAGMVTATTDDVPVTLLRPTTAGEKYAIFLYQDNGDGQFDFKTDLLVTQNGQPVATAFTAQ